MNQNQKENLLASLAVTLASCVLFSLLLRARVFLGLKSVGLYFFPLKSLRRLSFWFWFITVRTRAMLLRTRRILESFDAAPPVTSATRRFESSSLKVDSCLESSSLLLVLISFAFARTILIHFVF